METESFSLIVLKHWVPVIISVGLGGFLAALLFPRLQQSWQENRENASRRRDLAEEIVRSFQSYITFWRRLRDISELGKTRKLSEPEEERRIEFIEERNRARDQLLGCLGVARIFFGEETVRSINDFLVWDEQQTAKRLEELPAMEEWRKYEEEIFSHIKLEIG